MKKIPKVALFFETSAVNDRRTMRGIAKYASLRGPWIFYTKLHPFYMMRGKDIWRKRILPELKSWGPDGIIAHVDERRAGDLIALNVPIIHESMAESKIGGRIAFGDDNLSIGKAGAEYFLNMGFKNYAFCGFVGISWSHTRSEAFCKRISAAGFEVFTYQGYASNIRQKFFVIEDQKPLCDWLKSLPKPVAVMACNDARAQQIIDACNFSDIEIPDNVAVLGVDNDDLVCDLTSPQISSVAIGSEKMGYEIANLLDNLMAGKKPKQTVVANHPTHVVARQSTEILAIDDPDVAKAVKFIRNHRRSEITVDDVVEATCLGRRALENRFRKILRRPIFHEIRRVRVEQVARMLLETTLPVYRIADELGYSSSEHIARPFRAEMGMSPQEYRLKYSF
jgi:LacI family transcriptional regulator